MYLFSKFFHPRNFRFAGRRDSGTLEIGGEAFPFQVRASGNDVYHISIRNESRWPQDHNLSGLTPLDALDAHAASEPARAALAPERTGTPAGPESPLTRWQSGADGSFALTARGNAGSAHARAREYRTFLATLPGAGFGVSGTAWLFQFRQRPDMHFYGMGEKSTPFEKSDRSHRFWNTDVWADHGTSRARDQAYDPDYISVPYVIIKRGNTYAGILLDNPHPSAISISPKMNVADQLMAVSQDAPYFFLGAEDGPPSLYILFGPSLPELTRKLQRLVGLSALPPLWALGHQQCRWGYRGAADLARLADGFDRHRFPNDGLWLDIDYMDGYRVFTYSKEHFTDPGADMRAVQKRGYKVVPILDPGVKREAGYAVYESGRAADVFCRNPEGGEFIGIVWPGYTVFPDFSLESARAWWAGLVADFAASGPDAAWLDMNDPATGTVDCLGMLFQQGRAEHGAYHNQYASLMAEATRQGFLRARPDRRPFLISRSGFTGGQKFSAHWTGDNWSNYHHLHMTIGKSLNLALSGMPFNGGDVGGFGGNCSDELLVDWYKTAFLFPFLRNHCVRTSRPQEPWAFTARTLRITRHFVRLRYKLLPYLYDLFIRNSESGEAILRPLFHDFQDTRVLPLIHVNDQFLTGPCILQAPFTVEGQEERGIILPAARWWRADRPGWIEGPTRIQARKRAESTPIFLREGSLIPMQAGTPTTNRKDLLAIELLICLSPGFTGAAEARYACDDGETFAFREGKRSDYRIRAGLEGGTLRIRITAESGGFGTPRITPVTLARFAAVEMETPDGTIKRLRAKAFRSDAWGAAATFYAWR